MNISLTLPEDFEIDEEFGICNCGHMADDLDTLSASKLYTFLTGDGGIKAIDHLRTINGVIVLCQVREPSGYFDFVRIVLSGNGLVMQSIKQGCVVFESYTSCLFTIFSWRRHKSSFNSLNPFLWS